MTSMRAIMLHAVAILWDKVFIIVFHGVNILDEHNSNMTAKIFLKIKIKLNFCMFSTKINLTCPLI